MKDFVEKPVNDKKKEKKREKKERKKAWWESGNLPKRQAASHFPTGPTTVVFPSAQKGTFLFSCDTPQNGISRQLPKW